MTKFVTAVLCLLAVAVPRASEAQNLVVTNARIIDGKGGVIERGSVVVRDGKIASVAAGARRVHRGRAADRRAGADGDARLHRRPPAHRPGQRRGMAEDPSGRAAPGVPRRRLYHRSVRHLPGRRRRGAPARRCGHAAGSAAADGQIIPLARAGAPGGGGRGGDPARFDTSRGPLRPTQPAAEIPPADTIKAVEAIAGQRYDFIKTVITTTPDGPETRTLKLIVDEGRKRNLPTITHAVSVVDTLAAVEARPAVLVHTPHIGQLQESRRQDHRRRRHPHDLDSGRLRPHFGPDNTPLFRDAPAVSLGDALQRRSGTGECASACRRPACPTATAPTPAGRRSESLADELRALRADVLAARHHEDHGAGRGARGVAGGLNRHARARQDGGHGARSTATRWPTSDDLLKVVTTIKGGRIVSDKRGARAGASR